MAGERKGIFYEALLKIVLDSLVASGNLKGVVHWNVKATGMTVTPDFTIGTNADKPNAVMLVTHSNSAKNSDMKSWRNLGELAECKLRLKSVPDVYNVAFDSVVKDSLKLVAAAAFDGQLVVGDRPYGEDLIRWIDNNHKSFPNSGEEKAEAIRQLVEDRDAVFLPLFLKLLADVNNLVAGRNSRVNNLWSFERKRKSGTAPTAKTTSVRRGLSKLLIFEDFDLAIRLYTRKRVQVSEVPQYVFDLGLARKSLTGASGSDSEVARLFQTLSVADVKSILGAFDTSKVESWTVALRNSPHIICICDYVDKNFASLCSPTKLFKQLCELHSNPNALANKQTAPINWPPREVWLFSFLVELIKASSKTSNGFGYAQLAQLVSKTPGMPRANNRVYSIVLSDWLLRRGKESMPEQVLQEMCRVLSEHLKSIGPNIQTVAQNLFEGITQNIIESKLCCYRGFDPLRILIENKLGNLRLVKIRSCYSQAANSPGQAGLMQMGVVASTLINWQSATDSGKDHKVKELCGRAAALRYSWDSTQMRFVPRQGILKLCLVVDGTWTQEDLDTLALSGWDEIFYPDQLDKLASAIV
jgi:hypothetical protein